jgi:hypothetical protein
MRRVVESAGSHGNVTVSTWERPDLGGSQLISPIIDAIKDSDIFVADITALNFNVTYELGFALGLGKRVIPVRNFAYNMDSDAIQQIGIFDTLIRQDYTNADELSSYIFNASHGQRIATNFPPDPSPLYIVLPEAKTDDLGQIKDRALRTGLRSREFDPTETPRLGATEAIRAVAVSRGVIVPLLAADLMFSVSSTTRSRPNRLSELYLGDPSAENEEVRLGEYFLERGEYRKFWSSEQAFVVGRKVRARDQLKSDRAKVVVDLSPRTHQLKRLKDLVLQWLAAGSKEFLLTAFWEYVLLLEISGKILEKDQDVHKRNHKLFELYQIF